MGGSDMGGAGKGTSPGRMSIPVGTGADLVDVRSVPTVLTSHLVHDGMISDVRKDVVDLGDAGTVTREFLDHPGAVVVVALRDIDGVDHVCLIRQYRHPVRTTEWELPAGLLDVEGEAPLPAAVRELEEEADLAAARWDWLLDFYSSPGGSTEALRVFLARDVRDTDGDGFAREGEEAGMTALWVPLDDAYEAVLAGHLHNPGAVVGIMAAWGARARGWSTLRPPEAPWPWLPGSVD